MCTSIDRIAGACGIELAGLARGEEVTVSTNVCDSSEDRDSVKLDCLYTFSPLAACKAEPC